MTTTVTWTDPLGVKRDGELLDTATVQHPQFGQVVASLYRTPERAPYTKEHYSLEMFINGKTHLYKMADLADGERRMSQLRAQG